MSTSSPVNPHSPLQQQQYQHRRSRGMWSADEHGRFLEALQKFPRGPWRVITNHIGTRSIRQVQAHAHKYQEQLSKRLQDGTSTTMKHYSLPLRPAYRIDLALITDQEPSLASTEIQTLQLMQPFDVEEAVRAELVTPLSLLPMLPLSRSQSSKVDEELTDNLPSLDESLDFFIERFSI